MITLGPADTLRGKTNTSSTSLTYTASIMELLTTTGAETYKNVQGQLTTSATTLYTVAASTQVLIREIRMVCTGGSDEAVQLFINGTVAANRIAQFTVVSQGSAMVNGDGITTYDSLGKLLSTSPFALTGDVTGSGSGTVATTIAANAVDNTKAADMAQATVKGRAAAAGTGDPTDLTPAQVKTLLAITNSDVSGLGTLATVSNLTGPITSVGAATTITPDAVDNTMLANMAAATIKGRATGAGTGDPTDLTGAQVAAISGAVTSVTAADGTITVGGTAAAPTIARPAITGDISIAGASNAATVTKINGTALSGLGTGLLKNTTVTGVPSIAVQGTDYYAPGGTDVAIADGGTGASTLPSGLLKGAGVGAITAAVAGTDYVGATSGSAIQKANGAGGLTAATASTDYVGPTTGAAIQKANGSGGLSAATAGTDYVQPISGTAIVKMNGAGGLASAVAGTDYYNPGGTDVAITDGGTGASTLPAGLLKGAGTSAITAAVAADIPVVAAGGTGPMSAATAASAGVAGYMTGTQASQMANWFGQAVFNVLDYGITPANSASTNVTNMNTLLQTTAPDNAVIYFPPGLYQFNASLTTLTKDFVFKADGRGNAQIALTANCAGNFITCLNTGFYTTFIGLTFVNFVTQSAGAVIAFQNNANPMVQDCFFVGSTGALLNNILDFTGTSAGTGGVIRNMYGQGWSGIGINIASPLDTVYMSDLELLGTTPGGSIATTGIQCTDGGALEMIDCQIIRCATLMNMAPASGKVVSAVFATNCFFDQGVTNALRVTGAGTAARSHFVACWFTISAVGTNTKCIQIDTSGASIHTGIEFQDCWILNATPGSTGTIKGLEATAIQDITINNCQFSGWTTDMEFTPASTGTCKPLIEGNTMDAAGGIGASATNIILNVGSFTYGNISIQGNTLGGTAIKLTDNSTQAATAQKCISGNIGLPMGKVTVANVQALTTVDTVLASVPIPIGSLRIGTTYRITGYTNRVAATGSIVTIRARLGTAGTTADAQVMALIPTFPATANTTSRFEMLLTCRAIGNGTTNLTGNGLVLGHVGATSTTSTTVTYIVGLATSLTTANSTVANFLTLTMANTTSSTTDVYNVAIEVLQQ